MSLYSDRKFTFSIEIEVRDGDSEHVIANRIRSQFWSLIYDTDDNIFQKGEEK